MVDPVTDSAAAAPAFDARDELEISTHAPRDDIVVVRLLGELDVASTDELLVALDAVDESRPKLTILDLGELRFLDSSGMHALTTAHKRARDGGRGFVLANPRHISHALTVSGLSSLFIVEPDVETAIAIHG